MRWGQSSPRMALTFTVAQRQVYKRGVERVLPVCWLLRGRKRSCCGQNRGIAARTGSHARWTDCQDGRIFFIIAMLPACSRDSGEWYGRQARVVCGSCHVNVQRRKGLSETVTQMAPHSVCRWQDTNRLRGLISWGSMRGSKESRSNIGGTQSQRGWGRHWPCTAPRAFPVHQSQAGCPHSPQCLPVYFQVLPWLFT